MAKRKIPSENIVISAAKEVIDKRGSIQSLNSFCWHVLDKIKETDDLYSLSNSRLKRLVLKIPDINIRAKTRKTPKMSILKTCPVCKSKVKKSLGKNLFGNKVAVGYRCGKCGFSGDLDAFTPSRYVFLLKK